MKIAHIFCFALLGVTSATTQCYYPDGSKADDDVPCFSGSSGSPCCDPNSICLSNGYCMNVAQPFVLSRQSCTDKSWSTASGCDDVCSSVTDARSRGCSLPLYNFDKTGKAWYCADMIVANSSSSTSCVNGDPFSLDNADIITNHGILKNASCVLETVSPTSVNIPQNESSNGNDSATSTGSNNNLNVAIGAGVGVPLGCLLIITLVWAILERKSRLGLQKSMNRGVPLGSPIQDMYYGDTDMAMPQRGHYHAPVGELDSITPGPRELDSKQAK